MLSALIPGEPTLLFTFVLFHTAKILLLFLISPSLALSLEWGFLPFHIRSEIHPLRVCYVLVPFIEVLVKLLVYVVPELIPKVLFQIVMPR